MARMQIQVHDCYMIAPGEVGRANQQLLLRVRSTILELGGSELGMPFLNSSGLCTIDTEWPDPETREQARIMMLIEHPRVRIPEQDFKHDKHLS